MHTEFFCLTNTPAPKPSAPYIDSILTETEPHKWPIRKHFCVLNAIWFREFENHVFKKTTNNGSNNAFIRINILSIFPTTKWNVFNFIPHLALDLTELAAMHSDIDLDIKVILHILRKMHLYVVYRKLTRFRNRSRTAQNDFLNQYFCLVFQFKYLHILKTTH